jgi:hypothetical protein
MPAFALDVTLTLSAGLTMIVSAAADAVVPLESVTVSVAL